MTMDAGSASPEASVEEFYPRDVLSHGLLTAEDEVALAKRIEAGLYAAHLLATGTTFDDATLDELEWLAADGDAARNIFIESNLRLAMATCRKFRKRGHSEDDVVQDAYHGLVKAVDRFDYTKGFKFSTFAVWWIRESIHTGIRTTMFLKQPEVLFNQIVKVRAVRLRLLDHTGTEPTAEQIAAECDLTEREVAKCLREDKPIASLQYLLTEDLSLGDVLPDDDASATLTSVEEALDRRVLQQALRDTLNTLSESEAFVVCARYGLDGKPPRSAQEVADELGMARQTVRIKEQQALARLRHPSVEGSLRSFLLPTG